MISMKNITLQREERRILDDVSLEIREGEHWAILGRNGSGKNNIVGNDDRVYVSKSWYD